MSKDESNKDPKEVEKKLTIKKINFPENEYKAVETTKKQIVLHHSVSGDNYKGLIRHWCSDEGRKKVATSFLITRKGEVIQLFDPKYYAYHIGVKSQEFKNNGIPYVNLNAQSIGIELLNYGYLYKADKQYASIYGHSVNTEDVVVYKDKFRGKLYFEKYPDEQLEALKLLLIELKERFNIPLKLHDKTMERNLEALKGTPGVWSHTSYRSDKSDIHPQPSLIEMLEGLE